MKKNQEIDCYIGKKLRFIRKKHKLTQADLAKHIGVSHQQVQQYEIGESRLSANTLFQLASIFNVNPGYFFEGAAPVNAVKNSIAQENLLCTERYRPLKILIVEDNEPEEVLLRKAIEQSEHKTAVYSVSNGEEALEFLRESADKCYDEKRPDIMFLDLNMPKKNGHEVLKFMKKNETYRDIQTIVFTNSINPEDMEESYKYFCSSYMKKSDDFRTLCEMIKKVINYWYMIVMPSMQYELA